jgi:hypothetical protein
MAKFLRYFLLAFIVVILAFEAGKRESSQSAGEKFGAQR